MLDVVCAVVVREGKAMLCRRPAGAHLAGQWEFPGGKVDPGESGREALAREIWEELRCTIDVGEALAPVEHTYPEVAIRLRPFLCALTGGEPQAHVHEEVGWFGREDIAGLELAEADRRVWELLAGNGAPI